MDDPLPPPIPGPFVELPPVESVRKRPGMFVGSCDYYGFVHYLVSPVALLLGHRPGRLAVTVREGEFVVEADVALPIEERPDGRLVPFEAFSPPVHEHGFEGAILNGLSERLGVEVRHNDRVETLEFRRGSRMARDVEAREAAGPRTTLTFAPDASILKVTSLPPAALESYLRRLSFLHPGVGFAATLGGETSEFPANRGVVDLFAGMAAPYQLLHEPIHIAAEDGPLHLEAIFAFHSWSERNFLCFINNGRAVEGGTHEQGLDDALGQIHKKFRLPKRPKSTRNGVIGLMSLQHPGADWEGCIKARVANPELRAMVRDLIVAQAERWLEARPETAEVLRNLQTFQFPELWS